MRVAYKDVSVRRKPGLWWLDRIEAVAYATAAPLYEDVVVVTSCNDGRHRRGSQHYDDQAEDVRILGKRVGGIVVPAGVLAGIVPGRAQRDALLAYQHAQAEGWAERMQAKLGEDFYVELEDDHIHVEYDPK